MKILHIDIETAPSLGYVWGLWNQNIGLKKLRQAGYILCFAAKWDGKDPAFFERVEHDGAGSVTEESRENMLRAAHDLLEDADVVVTYNGDKFDLKTLNAEFAEAGLAPPASYSSVDLYKTVRRQFKFPSKKLAYVCERLGVGAKASTGGFDLWTGCMNEDSDAWSRMERYNKQDVRIQEELYRRILPWIYNHPNHGLYNMDGERCCPQCGGSRLWSKGLRYTMVQAYRRYQCQDCGGWARENVKQSPTVPMRRA